MGLDCFSAVNKVGKLDKVIGVDMPPEILDILEFGPINETMQIG